MGTNYYLVTDACPTCGHGKRQHIGKSSGGWCFSLATHPDDGINDLPDWLARFADGEIRNEYGETVSTDEMIGIITRRKWPARSWDGPWQPHYVDEAEFHQRNHSLRGPDGLARHQLGRHCVKHGEGTWDCMVGVFS
jgi:hypothetical protein